MIPTVLCVRTMIVIMTVIAVTVVPVTVIVMTMIAVAIAMTMTVMRRFQLGQVSQLLASHQRDRRVADTS